MVHVEYAPAPVISHASTGTLSRAHTHVPPLPESQHTFTSAAGNLGMLARHVDMAAGETVFCLRAASPPPQSRVAAFFLATAVILCIPWAASGAATSPKARGGGPQWYEGIAGIKVFSPGEAGAQAAVDAIAASQHSAVTGQFNSNRFAILLRSGEHALNISVGYYTSIIGVGAGPGDVSVANVQSFDVEVGGATQNFWRSAEGLTVTGSPSTWAVSQASPLRRMLYHGDLWLSEQGPGVHWSSGGFMADVTVRGQLHTGTQQQWFFRNSELNTPADVSQGGWNFVFAGVNGAPVEGPGSLRQVSTVDTTPRIAEKPYLVEDDATGSWQVWVPPYAEHPTRGAVANHSSAVHRRLTVGSDVLVIRADRHKGSDMNALVRNASHPPSGILLTPGIYHMDEPFVVPASDFVVLGLGFPTLVSAQGAEALSVADGLNGVRVAGVLLEAGTAVRKNPAENQTRPLLRCGTKDHLERGSSSTNTRIVFSDIFARVGAFSYATNFKKSCMLTQATTMVEVNCPGALLDNTWFWHADHDDCGTASDRCYSAHGLVVSGDNVTAYGLAVEHEMSDLVQWAGENGRVYFFQSELPYHDATFGSQGSVGYAVGENVSHHQGLGLGVYIIGETLRVQSAFKVPPAANLTNMVTLVLGGQTAQFAHMVCSPSGQGRCIDADSCSPPACYLGNNQGHWPPTPPPPGPTPAAVPGSCRVGSDAFLQGQAGPSPPNPVGSWQGCALACQADSNMACRYWKFGHNGNWCQFFSNDGSANGWPISGAVNQSGSVVVSGTVPGNHC